MGQQERVTRGVEKSHSGIRKEMEHQLVDQQTRRITRTLFHECPIAVRHPKQRTWLQSSYSCAWPNLSRVLLTLTFNTIVRETLGHQMVLALSPHLRVVSGPKFPSKPDRFQDKSTYLQETNRASDSNHVPPITWYGQLLSVGESKKYCTVETVITKRSTLSPTTNCCLPNGSR